MSESSATRLYDLLPPAESFGAPGGDGGVLEALSDQPE